MTREEARERIRQTKAGAEFYAQLVGNSKSANELKDIEAFNMAIEALSEPRGDIISREAAINHIAKEIHTNAIEHGWWEEERSLGEIVALCHSELSEALEAYRNGEPMMWMNEDKPDGIAIEMIDCMIRILDYLAKENIDIDRLLMMKHEYNKTRAYKHGNKKL